MFRLNEWSEFNGENCQNKGRKIKNQHSNSRQRYVTPEPKLFRSVFVFCFSGFLSILFLCLIHGAYMNLSFIQILISLQLCRERFLGSGEMNKNSAPFTFWYRVRSVQVQKTLGRARNCTCLLSICSELSIWSILLSFVLFYKVLSVLNFVVKYTKK